MLLNGSNHIFAQNMMFFDHIRSDELSPSRGAKSKKNMTCESKPNHHNVTFFSVNRVFEKEIEVLRSRECHSHLRNDLLYLLHLSDLKKVHYESSYGHFIEKVQHNNNNNVLSMCRFLLNVHIDRTPGN